MMDDILQGYNEVFEGISFAADPGTKLFSLIFRCGTEGGRYSITNSRNLSRKVIATFAMLHVAQKKNIEY